MDSAYIDEITTARLGEVRACNDPQCKWAGEVHLHET